MKKKISELPLRNGVGIVVLNKQNKVFVAKRIDNPKNFWQMPQGGVDEGELPDSLAASVEYTSGLFFICCCCCCSRPLYLAIDNKMYVCKGSPRSVIFFFSFFHTYKFDKPRQDWRY